MKKRNNHVFLWLILMPVLYGCCNPTTYELTITGMETRALIFDGINFIAFDGQDSIAKEDWVIEVLFTNEENIASAGCNQEKNDDPKVLKAAVVPCEDQIVEYMNSIERITVMVRDPEGNASIDITNQVLIEGSDQTLSEYILENNGVIGGFLIELSDTTNIPDRINYVIESILDDGSTISAEGGVVLFN